MAEQPTSIRRMAALRSVAQFREYAAGLGLDFPIANHVTPAPDGPLAQPATVAALTIGNRFATLPMEGWDASDSGHPTPLVERRWRRFGQSGAKLIWGGEAVAVRPDGRANPNQLVMAADTVDAIRDLRLALVEAHREAGFTTADLVVGVQLTHSGRFARPYDKKRLEPTIAYRHPLLAEKYGLDDSVEPLSDAGIRALVDDFVVAAQRAWQAGFHFVDIKHCHGYFAHELLSATTRPGDYGGSLENRLRFLEQIVDGIRATVPDLRIGVRLSVADTLPFQKRAIDKVGEPMHWQGAYPFGFGMDQHSYEVDLSETLAAIDRMTALGVQLVCLTLSSPYWTPHWTRPALFPPSDGYLPPEDPLVGVARHIRLSAALKSQRPDVFMVGSGYTYLQEWVGHVAEATVGGGLIDSVGLGRMLLSYPELPADLLAGRGTERKRLCRTFSECTTGPRNGMISGCYPLDDFYRHRPEAKLIDIIKQQV